MPKVTGIMNMKAKGRTGFTLVEVLIVVVIMAVLAATIIPQFTDTTTDAKKNTSVFNLNTLRAQVETYKAQHNGKVPTALNLLTQKTDKAGTASATGAYGPYISAIPEETITGTNNVVTITGSSAAIGAGDVTAAGGWLYNNTTGELRINEANSLTL
jgi:general secretion pathway protein G